VTSPNSATITKLITTAVNRNRIAFIIGSCKDTQSRAGLRDSGDFDELLPSYQPNATRPSEIAFYKSYSKLF
jgi:hypothetical protein